MKFYKLSYWAFRSFGFGLSKLSFKNLQRVGSLLGTLLYYVAKEQRKLTLNHLALVQDRLPRKDIKKLAKEAFQNLIITTLEYFKFASSSEDEVRHQVFCKNPEIAEPFLKKGQGIVFFAGHMANWEVQFLEATLRFSAAAVARPIKNLYLYRFIQKMRTRFGGLVIDRKNALGEAIDVLRKGTSVALVADQALPESDYSSLFFGKKAYTSTAPALLACRAKVPLMVVGCFRREDGRYEVEYKGPILPNPAVRLKEDVVRMMDEALEIQESMIKKAPGQWLWLHRRWKQHGINHIRSEFRYDAVLVILPKEHHSEIERALNNLRIIYGDVFFTLMGPKAWEKYRLENEEWVEGYPLDIQYKYQLIFDFAGEKEVCKHYLKLGAHVVLGKRELLLEASKNGMLREKGKEEGLEKAMFYALTKPEYVLKHESP